MAQKTKQPEAIFTSNVFQSWLIVITRNSTWSIIMRLTSWTKIISFNLKTKSIEICMVVQ